MLSSVVWKAVPYFLKPLVWAAEDDDDAPVLLPAADMATLEVTELCPELSPICWMERNKLEVIVTQPSRT